jgi:hypothetical protein
MKLLSAEPNYTVHNIVNKNFKPTVQAEAAQNDKTHIMPLLRVILEQICQQHSLHTNSLCKHAIPMQWNRTATCRNI